MKEAGDKSKMQRLLLVFSLLLVFAASPLQAQNKEPDLGAMPLAELERMMPDEHPYGYFILAARTFAEGEKQEAVRWLYVGQIRWRFHIAANPNLPPDGDPALLASMMEVVARPINEWAGGDVDQWIASMQAALDWDAATPNGFTSKSEHSAEHETVRSGLGGLIASIDEQRTQIPRRRSENGLENRAP
jgi:soluble cytochrome b562